MEQSIRQQPCCVYRKNLRQKQPHCLLTEHETTATLFTEQNMKRTATLYNDRTEGKTAMQFTDRTWATAMLFNDRK